MSLVSHCATTPIIIVIITIIIIIIIIIILYATKHDGNASDYTLTFCMRWNSIAQVEQFVAF